MTPDMQEIRARYSSRLAEGEEARAAQVASHSEVREAFTDLNMILDDILPKGRYHDLVVTYLEIAAMFANKAVASPHPVVPAHKEGRQSLEEERLREGTQGLEVVKGIGQRSDETYGQYLDRQRQELVDAVPGLEINIEGLSDWGKTAEKIAGRIDESGEGVERGGELTHSASFDEHVEGAIAAGVMLENSTGRSEYEKNLSLIYTPGLSFDEEDFKREREGNWTNNTPECTE